MTGSKVDSCVVRLITCVLVPVLLAGCARDIPLMSHVHMGHALSTWRDTPEQHGLFKVVEIETAQAYGRASNAVTTSNPKRIRRHLNAVTALLNSDIELPDDVTLPDSGYGKPYGAVRALRGAMRHVKFAAESDDASQNIREGATAFLQQGTILIRKFEQALALSQQTRRTHDENLHQLALEIDAQLYACLNGFEDADEQQAGLRQMRDHLRYMISSEKNPSYRPVERKYLLGLRRLPDGKWTYRFNRDAYADSGI